MTRPAEPERHDPTVGQNNPDASTWEFERPYLGPPEEGQPRIGNGRPKNDLERRYGVPPRRAATAHASARMVS
jgi:hypothetical protein